MSISRQLCYLKNGDSITIQGVTIHREQPVIPTGSGRLYHICPSTGRKAAYAGPTGYQAAFERGALGLTSRRNHP